MLDRVQLFEQLQSKKKQFTAYDRGTLDGFRQFRDGMSALVACNRSDVDAILSDTDYPGARPTDEYSSNLAISYNHGWQSSREAIKWVIKTIADTPVYAIDGSQIWAEQDLSVPVAAIQVGWYENRGDGTYEKNVRMELLAPDELVRMVRGEKGERSTAYSQAIGLRRHTMEVETLRAYIESQANTKVKPVCLFDGPLVLSYADRFSPARQRAYVDPMCRMLAASERNRVPVFGYTDNSAASDLVTMLSVLNGWEAPAGLSDAWILNHFLGWGDRSQAYLCTREGILGQYRDPDTGRSLRDQVCFLYLQPEQEADHPPARLEFPRWMLDEGVLDKAVQVVLADAVYGDGYPYSAGTVDEIAVLDKQDWESFTEIVQQFLEREAGITLRWSRKRNTKRFRRR